MGDQKTKAQVKINYEIIPTSCPPTHTDMSQPPPPTPTPNPNLCHAPIIHNNNTMDKEFLIQMRQFNKRGSVRNEE